MESGEEPPPRIIVTSKQYDKDAKKVRGRGKEMARLVAIVDAIRNRELLDPRHRDHSLGLAAYVWSKLARPFSGMLAICTKEAGLRHKPNSSRTSTPYGELGLRRPARPLAE